MIRNNRFKTTLGIFAQIAIVAALDTSDGTASGASPATVTVPVTIGASPTIGESITINVDGVDYLYTIPGGGATTQQAHDAIAALLAANTQGFLVTTHSGTTSSVYQLAWAGVDKNAKAVTLSEVGTTFTVAGPYAFAGAVAGDAVAADSLKAFKDNAAASTIWAFWEDTKLPLVAGDTFNAANINRKFFYAWKQGTVTRITTPLPVKSRVYDRKAYVAGTAEVMRVAVSGTIAATQILHVRILETTATIIPYPSWDYEVPFTTDINTTVTALRAKVNAETSSEKFVTAGGSGANLDLTSGDVTRRFKVTAYLEVSATQPTDQSVFTITTTAVPIAPVGDYATVVKIEEYGKTNAGGIVYAPEGTVASEFASTYVPNAVSGTQYSFLLVTALQEEAGIVRDYKGRPAVLIGAPNAVTLALAAL